MFKQIQQQIGGALSGFKGSPFVIGPSVMHKITFNIRDKSIEMKDLTMQRKDSLIELTSQSLKRSRTKSEAVKDISH